MSFANASIANERMSGGGRAKQHQCENGDSLGHAHGFNLDSNPMR